MTTDTKTVVWPLIKKGTVDYREYQVNLAKRACSESTLIVLSTGLGKTIIAGLAAAQRLHDFPNSKVLFLAPSRPLVDQQARFLRSVLDLQESEVLCLTGHDGPENRRDAWKTARVFAMTPQALQNDLIQRSYDLEDVSLIVYDEAHRGVGDYAYTFIAEIFEKQAKNPLSLGLTASPGHKAEHVKIVQQNLRLSQVEVRTEKDPDVRKYIVSVESDVKYITLPSEIEVLRDMLYSLLDDYTRPVVDSGYSLPTSRRLSRKEILKTQGLVRKEIGSHTKPPPKLFFLIRNLTAALRIVHLIEFIGTQGLAPT
ncbi:MAG: DEAD/DEAH box helicase, partial [Candidatus Thorarchaeota archaeon]